MLPVSQSWSTSRPAPRGSTANQAQESRRGSLANTRGSLSISNPIISNPHATPPRPNGPRPLPTSSPTSERLRRIAPRPIQVTSRSRLQFPPRSPVQQVPSLSRVRRANRTQVSFDLRAVDHVDESAERLEGDVEQWSSSIQQYLASQGVSPGRPMSDTSSFSQMVDVPILLDLGGRYADRSQSAPSIAGSVEAGRIPRDLREPDFLQVEPQPRMGNERMTPERYMRANYVPEVLVDFNTDVFAPRPAGQAPAALHPDEYDPHDRSPSPNPTNNEPYVRGSITATATSVRSRSSTTSSFYAPERRDSLFENYRFPQPVAYTQPGPSTGPDQVEHPNADRTPARRGLVDLPQEPSLAPHRVDSSDSIYSDLITPAHVSTALPHHQPDAEAPPAPRHLRFRGLQPAAAEEYDDEDDDETVKGLELDTGRGSIDSERARAVEHAGGTPRVKRKIRVNRPTPPVPAIPLHFARTPFIKITPSVHEVMTIDSTFGTPPSIPRKVAIESPTEARTWPEDLRNFDREMTVELHVDQERGPSYCVSMPFRRLTRPGFWQLREDEALARACTYNEEPPRPQPFQQTGAVVFGQESRGRDSWVLDNHSQADTPILHAITANEDYTRSYTEHVELNIDEAGIYHAYGLDRYGEVEWMFEYLVKYTHRGPSNRIMEMGRHVFPMFLYATTAFFEKSPPNPLDTPTFGRRYKGFVERLPTPTLVRRAPVPLPKLPVLSAPALSVTEASPALPPHVRESLTSETAPLTRARSDTVTSHSEKEKISGMPRLLEAVKRPFRSRPTTPVTGSMQNAQASGSGSSSGSMQNAQASGSGSGYGYMQNAQASGSGSGSASSLPSQVDQETPTKSHGGVIKGLLGKLGGKSRHVSQGSTSRGHSPLSSVMTINEEGPEPNAALSRVDSQTPNDTASNHSGPSLLQRFADKARNVSRPSSRGGTPIPAVLDESGAGPSRAPSEAESRPESTKPEKRPRSHSLLSKFARPFTPDKDVPPVPDISSPTPMRSLKGIKSLSSLNPNAPPRSAGKGKAPPVPCVPKLPATAAPIERVPGVRGPMVLAQQNPEHHPDIRFRTEIKALPEPIPGSIWTHLNDQPTHHVVRRLAPPEIKPKKTMVPREAYTSATRPTARPNTAPFDGSPTASPAPQNQSQPHSQPIRAPEPMGRSLPPPPRPGFRRRPSTTDAGF